VYIFVYGQQVFASQLLAEGGPIPTAPAFIGLNCVTIASIVVTFGDITLPSSRFLDIRPTLAFRSNGSTTSSDHNSLSNLTVGNAHPQYFRVDGTSAMAGTMNLNSNNITNIGTANGVTIQAHASRHLPGGADPLTTAAPSINLSPSSTNTVGIANSFSRSDHTHTINTALIGDIQVIGSANSAGTSNNYARGDHTHRGVHSIKVPLGSNEYGDITLTAGTSMSITDIAGNFTFDAITVLNDLLPSIATGFDVDYTSGSVIIDGQFYSIPAGTITLPANTTGIIYVDPTTQLVSSTTGSIYPTDSVPIASYVTNGVIVTTLTDNRTYVNNAVNYPLSGNKGGTGFDTYTIGDLLYADTTSTLAKLADVATGNALISGGVGVAPSYGKIGLTTHVSGILPIANGGTNSSTALNGDRVMLSNATSIIESSALLDGQLIIGRTGLSPLVANITATANQVNVTNGAGTITLSLPQDIALISSPSFASLSLTNTTNQLTFGTTNTITINSIAPSASRSYTIPDVGTNSSFVMTDGNQTINGVKSFSTAIAATSGGTGQSVYAVGDLLYANTTTTLAKLADVATGNALISGGVGVAPSYGKIGLTTHISGILPIANGGTNSSTALNGNRVMLSNATSIIESSALLDGQIIIGNTVGAPIPANITAGSGVSITNGANSITISATGSGGTVTSVSVSGGTSGLTYTGNPVTGSGTITLSSGALVPSFGGLGTSLTPNPGAIIYSATGTTLNQTTVGTSGQVLQSNGAGAPTWTTNISGNAANVTGVVAAVNGGTGQSSYAVGDLLYADTTTTIAKLADVAVGSYLRSGGVNTAPSWSTLTLPNTATIGDLLFASAANTITNLADVATGNALISGGVGVAPLYGKIGLTTHISGILPIANGGTNSSTALNNNRIMVSNGGSIVESAALTDGQLLIGSTGLAPVVSTLTAGSGVSISNGAGSITISATGSGGTVTSVSVSGGTSGLTYTGNPVTGSGTITLSSGALVPSFGGLGTSLTPNPGAIIYSATGTTLNQTAVGTSGQVLQSNGTGAPTWTTNISGNAANVTGVVAAVNGGTGQSVYAVGDLLYANTTTTLAKLADVATGNALISGGVGVAPSYGKIGLTIHVSGVLPIANGGTNSSTALSNGRLMWSAAGAIVEATALSNGQVFIGSTGSSPVAATLTAGSGISITNAAGSITITSTGSTVTAAVNTTSSVNTTLDTIATTTNSAGCTEWFVTAYDTVSNNALSRRIFATYRNVAGVVTILRTSVTTNVNAIGGGSNTAVVASGTNVILQINGHSSNLCRWKSQRSIYFDA